MPAKEGLLSDPFVKMVWCQVLSDAVTLALVAAGAVIAIGFLSDYLFSRPELPDMLFLRALGLVLGPISVKDWRHRKTLLRANSWEQNEHSNQGADPLNKTYFLKV